MGRRSRAEGLRRQRASIRSLGGAARNENGFSLVDLLVVMVILGLVMAGLTTTFVSGSRAELHLNRRFQAQQQARLALHRIRADVHCASAAQAQTINGSPGVKLAVGSCYSATPTVSWCVLTASVTPPRYQLWRSTATSSICSSSDTTRVLVADYLTASANVLVTNTIPFQGLETVDVDFHVNVSPSTGRDDYELKDSIVAANSTRCATSGGCSVPAVA